MARNFYGIGSEPAPEQSASAAIPTASPENTPLPGGGSWHWDYAIAAWVENAPAIEPVTE